VHIPPTRRSRLSSHHGEQALFSAGCTGVEHSSQQGAPVLNTLRNREQEGSLRNREQEGALRNREQEGSLRNREHSSHRGYTFHTGVHLSHRGYTFHTLRYSRGTPTTL